jgi:hypothetical protein
MSEYALPLTPEQYAERVKVAVAAGALGATIAVLVGRPITRIDNMVIGGLFTAFAAYRDPRGTTTGTLFVAAIEGAIWGATDQLVPKLKDYLMPPPEMHKGLVPSSLTPEPVPVAGYGYGY